MKLDRGLIKIEAIRQIVGRGVGVAERREPKILLNEFQDAAKVMCDVRDVGSLGVWRHYDQWNSETVYIARSPTRAVVDDSGRRNVIIPPSPVVPGNDDDGVGQI
jgi:hypothetical protein